MLCVTFFKQPERLVFVSETRIDQRNLMEITARSNSRYNTNSREFVLALVMNDNVDGAPTLAIWISLICSE
jgi:hypothetical protein